MGQSACYEWNRFRGKLIFSNAGLVGGNGKMKDRLSFVVDYNSTEVMPGDVQEYFLSPELTEGGYRFRNGSMGGFMTFAGHGYSYESYICFLRK
jgi:hypothetical protein